MTDKLEALSLEAETLSGLMMQLAENEIDSDSFAVMSDLGENGQEHDCDLPITETALRASAVIDQLLAALKDKDQRIAELKAGHSEAAKQISSWRNLAKQNIAEREKDIAALEAAKQRNAELEQRLQQPIKLPKDGFCPAEYEGSQLWVEAETRNKALTECAELLKKQGFKVEGE